VNLEIRTTEKTIFTGQAEAAVFPARDGEIGILEDHAPLATILVPGTVRITQPDGASVNRPVGHGFLIVKDNSVSALLTDQTQ
jgi:F-type H+-transporting ATPase subunit epsilon